MNGNWLNHVARAYPDQQLRLVMDNHAPQLSWMNMVEIWSGVRIRR